MGRVLRYAMLECSELAGNFSRFGIYGTLCPLLTTTEKKDVGSAPPIVIPTPGKRGRKKKSDLSRVGPTPAGHMLPTGSEALILAHLAAGGQVCLLVSSNQNMNRIYYVYMSLNKLPFTSMYISFVMFYTPVTMRFCFFFLAELCEWKC